MIFIYGLRLVSDLAFYFFFANCIVKSPVLVAIPAVIYAVYLIVGKKLDTTWDRQVDFFSKGWKLFLAIGVLMWLIGKGTVLVQRAIPMAVLYLSTSVLLLRMLRHGPDIYLNKNYQRKNFFLLMGVFGGTWFLSSKWMLNMVTGFFSLIYNYCVLPILTFIITCVTALIGLVMKLLSFLHLTEIDLGESKLPGSSEVNPFKEHDLNAITQGKSAEMVFTIIGILILVAGAILLFRWLSSKNERLSTHDSGSLLSKSTLPEAQKERSATVAGQVRRQYRKYLKLCKSYGAKITKSDTSATVAAESEKLFDFFSDSSEIREIYIRARYNNQATKADLRKLKQMYQTIKQKL